MKMFKRAISLSVTVAMLLTQLLEAQTSENSNPSQPTAGIVKPAPLSPNLQDGTPVKLRLGETISSANAHAGQTVEFDVLEEVRVGEVTIIPKGGVAWATVTEAHSKKSMGRGGVLNVNVDSVRLADGEKVALRAVEGGKGGGRVGAMTGAIVATSIVFFPAAPLFLFIHGKDITIPKGTEVTAFINGDVPLVLAKFQPQAPVPVSASTERTTIEFTSVPLGADIELDGAYAGSTPSSEAIVPGEHTIKIMKSGYKVWEKKLNTTVGHVNVAAQLEQGPSARPTTVPQSSSTK
jgi:hypothetical protein